MKSGWPTKTLGEICGFVRGPFGGSLKKSVFVADGFAVYEQQHAIYNQFENIRYFIDDAKFQEMRRFEPRPNDLIMSCSGTMGMVAIVPDNIRRGIINQALLKLTPLEVVSPEFLKYWMDSSDFQDSLKEQSGGVAIQNVASVGVLKEIKISLPPLPEQQRIVGILDEAFEDLATAKANAERNLHNARALFESHLQSVFTEHGTDWKMEKLDNLTKLARGHNPPKSKFSREQKPGYVRFYQIRDGATDDYTVYVPDTPQLHKMIKDDIMMVAYRHVGRAFRGVEGAFNVALCKISNARRDLLDDDFLFHLIPSQYVKGELLKRSERSLIPSMSIEHLREIKIPLPPISEQKRLVETIRNLTEETQRLESIYQQKLAVLDELKKSLLHQAFSGAL